MLWFLRRQTFSHSTGLCEKTQRRVKTNKHEEVRGALVPLLEVYVEKAEKDKWYSPAKLH
jgi:hypothetical protein